MEQEQDEWQDADWQGEDETQKEQCTGYDVSLETRNRRLIKNQESRFLKRVIRMKKGARSAAASFGPRAQVKHWLCYTGCAHDLVSQKHVSMIKTD